MIRGIKIRNFIFNPEKKPKNFKIDNFEQHFNNTLNNIKGDKLQFHTLAVIPEILVIVIKKYKFNTLL